MVKAIVIFSLILFAVLFVLGFVAAPWLCLISFVPLVTGIILLMRNRYIK